MRRILVAVVVTLAGQAQVPAQITWNVSPANGHSYALTPPMGWAQSESYSVSQADETLYREITTSGRADQAITVPANALLGFMSMCRPWCSTRPRVWPCRTRSPESLGADGLRALPTLCNMAAYHHPTSTPVGSR